MKKVLLVIEDKLAKRKVKTKKTWQQIVEFGVEYTEAKIKAEKEQKK